MREGVGNSVTANESVALQRMICFSKLQVLTNHWQRSRGGLVTSALTSSRTSVKKKKMFLLVCRKLVSFASRHNSQSLYSGGTQLFLTCVRVSGGIREVEGGLVMSLLKCFPTYHFVKSTIAPEADCHPAYRRRASHSLIDSGRGHSLTLSLHIKDLLRGGNSQWGYITSFSVFTATFAVCSFSDAKVALCGLQ